MASADALSGTKISQGTRSLMSSLCQLEVGGINLASGDVSH